MKRFSYKICYSQRFPIYRNYKLLKFKRKKWYFLNQVILKKSKNLNSLDMNFIPLFFREGKFPLVFRKKLLFKNNLLLIKRFRFLDVNLKKKTLKLLGRNKKDFIVQLNSRLDVILYKTRLFSSVGSVTQFLKHEGVFINNKLVLEGGVLLKENDIISFNPVKRVLYKKLFNKFYIIKTKSFQNILEINYDLFIFVVKDLSKSTVLKSIFPNFYKEVFWSSRINL